MKRYLTEVIHYMTPIIHRTPLMMLETLGLLYIESNFQDLRPLEAALWGEDLMQQAETQQRLRLYERYVQEFRQYRESSDAWEFFGAIPIGEYVLLGVCFLLVRELLYRDAGWENGELRGLLEQAYQYIWDSGLVLIDFEGCDRTLESYLKQDVCSEEFSALCREPERYFPQLAELVRKNIPAAEMAWEAVRPEVRRFMDRYWQSNYFLAHSLFSKDAHVREIYPVFFTIYSSWMIGDTCYCGIYNITVPQKSSAEEERKLLLNVSKALSDPSRLDILTLLREKPCYNREIAEKLGLSPATVMHHTDLLIQSGLVALAPWTENQKRIYFQLVPEQIKRYEQILTAQFI